MDLCEALRAAVRRGPDEQPRPGRPRTVREVLEVFGGGPGTQRRGIGVLAARLTGTQDLSYRRRGREFRSAVRRLERYAEGSRRPAAPYLRELRKMASREQSRRRHLDRRQQLRQFGSPIRIRGQVTVSADSRYRTVGGSIPMYLSGEAWGKVIEALDQRDCDTAEEEFSEALGREHFYGTPPVFEDVEYLETR